MLIVTNFEGFPGQWTTSCGVQGRSVQARSWREFILCGSAPDAVVLVNCNPKLVLQLATTYAMIPFRRPPLVAVDLVLRRPKGVSARVGARIKKALFGRVDHFIHYFRDLAGYQQVYGIGPERSSFVPFKPNIRYRHQTEPQPEGDYALCLGHSQRDYDTFFRAAERLSLPAAIPEVNIVAIRQHGGAFSRSLADLPGNIRVLRDDGSAESLVHVLNSAKVVVLPILKDSMLAGISIALNAMLLGKCVIASQGPGISDVFSEEVLTVPPEDSTALAAMIERVWNDDDLRTRTAAAGHRYALSLGGEAELYQRIVEEVVMWRQRCL